VGPEAGDDSTSGLRCRLRSTGELVPAYVDEEDNRIKCELEETRSGPLQYEIVEGFTGANMYGSKIFEDSMPDKEMSVAPNKVEGGRAAENIEISGDPMKEAVEKSSRRKIGGLGPFAIMSLSYILFTTTDGGVRIIVLLHAYNQGFTALALAAIFSGYELAGMIVNLLAGMAGARWGFKATLIAGLGFQTCALAMLMGWQDSWNMTQAIVYITVSQVLNGIAKDLVKLGGKSVTKLVTPEEKQLKLFKLVALVTGFKNSFKGVGYLIGAALLTANYYAAVGVMLALVGVALPFAILGLDWKLGRMEKKNATFRQAFVVNHNVSSLSVARFFLFASRDLWFEVTLPYFLRSPAGLDWSRLLVGVFLAVWIIVYGQVQSWSPKFVLKPLKQSPPNKWVATLWAAILVSCPAIMAGVLLGSHVYGVGSDKAVAIAVITVVLYLFCLIFAINSAVHSYLIVRYAEGNKVATSVGVYYSANAGGRLIGTLLSGFLYTYAGDTIVTGFGYCFVASVVFVALSSVLTLPIRDNLGGLACGPCLQIGATDESQ